MIHLQVTWKEAWCKEFHPDQEWGPWTFAPCWSRNFTMSACPFSTASNRTV